MNHWIIYCMQDGKALGRMFFKGTEAEVKTRGLEIARDILRQRCPGKAFDLMWHEDV